MTLKELKKHLERMEAAHGEDIEVCISDASDGGHYNIWHVGPVYPCKDGQMFVDDTSVPPTCIEIC